MSAAGQRSCVSKNTREPSAEAPLKNALDIGVSAGGPVGDDGDRRAGPLVDVVGDVGVARHQYLVGVQPHLRPVRGGAREEGVVVEVVVAVAPDRPDREVRRAVPPLRS